MKATITETRGDLTFLRLDPDDEKEIAQLLRLTRNAKPDGVDIMTDISGDHINAEIAFTKYKSSLASIRNTDRKKL